MWFHFLSWAEVAQKCGPSEGSVQRGRRQALGSESPLLLYNLSLAFPQDVEARLTDFHGRIKEHFFSNQISFRFENK